VVIFVIKALTFPKNELAYCPLLKVKTLDTVVGKDPVFTYSIIQLTG
jgi:hypothetical protein